MRNNGDQNLIVLTLYIIGVFYVFNRMIESIDDQVKFEFKKADVDQQLKEQDLEDKIGISFKLKSSYSLDELKDLLITIENKSDNIAVYVDWDNTSLVDSKSRRVIRKSPDLTRDLAVPQSPSLIVPKKTLTEAVTAEDVFERDQVAGTYSAKKPIVNINGLKSGGPPQKKTYNDFINRRKELDFSLQLVLRLSEVRAGLAPGVNFPLICIINCPFSVRKLPWTYALPWNKKK